MEPMLVVSFLYIAFLAGAAGLISGILGGGGNVLAMPFMLWIYKYMLFFPPSIAMKITIATSLAVIIFSSLSATIGYIKLKSIEFSLLKQIVIPLIMGSLCGSQFVSYIDGVVLQNIFGGLILVLSIYLFLNDHIKINKGVVEREIIYPSKFIMLILSLIIGFNSGLLGLGSGIMLMPLLFLLNYKAHKVAGTASACTLIMSIFGTTVFLINGVIHPLHIPYSVGFIYLPALLIMAPITFIFARIGVVLSGKMSNQLLFKLFTSLMFILGIKMLI